MGWVHGATAGIPTTNIVRQALQTSLANYALLLTGITSYFQNPQEASVLTLTNLATACGLTAPPRKTYTRDGANEQWTEWQQMVEDSYNKLRLADVEAAGPFCFRARR
jgi:hypothetical protein